MKKTFFAILFMVAAFTMSAQHGFPVTFQGKSPSISDFAWAFLDNYVDEGEEDEVDESARAIKLAWIQHSKGLPLDEGETLTIDQKNGFVLYEFMYEEHLLRIEMCYWNEADKKHKLFAYNVSSFTDGVYDPGQFDGIVYYRYNNATQEMAYCDDPKLPRGMMEEGGVHISYALPRTGKDLTVTYWKGHKKTQKTMKWNGKNFK